MKHMNLASVIGIFSILISCAGEKFVVDAGKIVDPDKFPEIVVEKTVNLYLVEWADDKCQNISINGANFEDSVDELYQIAAKENVSEDAIVQHWGSKYTTAIEDKHLRSFMKNHEVAGRREQFDKTFCAAIAKEIRQNTAVGKMLDINP